MTVESRLCKLCGRRLSRADQLARVWGFQRWNGHPELPTLAYYQCSCDTTLAIELPSTVITEATHAHPA